ncbi:hypothetical protein RFI_36675, partial [Reticulomyxa filosa]
LWKEFVRSRTIIASQHEKIRKETLYKCAEIIDECQTVEETDALQNEMKKKLDQIQDKCLNLEKELFDSLYDKLLRKRLEEEAEEQFEKYIAYIVELFDKETKRNSKISD